MSGVDTPWDMLDMSNANRILCASLFCVPRCFHPLPAKSRRIGFAFDDEWGCGTGKLEDYLPHFLPATISQTKRSRGTLLKDSSKASKISEEYSTKHHPCIYPFDPPSLQNGGRSGNLTAIVRLVFTLVSKRRLVRDTASTCLQSPAILTSQNGTW